MCKRCDALIKAIDAYIEKVDDTLEETLDNEGYVASKRTVKTARAIEDSIAGLLEDETALFIQKINESVDLETFAKSVFPDLVLTDTLAVKAAKVFREQFEEFMPTVIDMYIKKTDRQLALSSISRRTTAWIGDWSSELGSIMQLNSHAEIESILTRGLNEGWGCNEFARQILDSGIRDEWYKARRVSLTETLRAHSVAQQEAFMQSPSVQKKLWRHTGAYRNEPRQNHVDMDGQIVEKDEPFSLTGADGGLYKPMYPRDTILPPSESINCHCIAEPVADEAILGLTLEERQKLQQEAIDNMDDEWERELDERNKAKAGIEVND